MADDVVSASGTLSPMPVTTEESPGLDDRDDSTATLPAEDDVCDDLRDTDSQHKASALTKRPRRVHMALIFGAVAAIGLGTLVGWLGMRDYQGRQQLQQRNLFLAVGRRTALDLTTIDWQHVDADVQRVLDVSTGSFREDFQKRSRPFIEVVKQAQSKSEGTITAAGLESVTGNEAQVMVAITVKTSTAGAPEQAPRSWRMRIDVQKTGDDAKTSNVEFVP